MECPSSSVGDGLFMAERVGDGLPVDERADGAISMESIVKLWTTYMIGICRGSDCRWYRDDDPTTYTSAPMLETARTSRVLLFSCFLASCRCSH